MPSRQYIHDRVGQLTRAGLRLHVEIRELQAECEKQGHVMAPIAGLPPRIQKCAVCNAASESKYDAAAHAASYPSI
jgi:hypothetical protein